MVTRTARISVARPGPDMVDAVLGAAPVPRRGLRRDAVLRLVLGVLGVGQLALGVMQLVAAATAGPAVAGHVAGHGGATPLHLAHESTAWNLALGVAFVWVASQRWRARGMLPVLASFVGVLAVLSAVDLVTGVVAPGRVVSHSLVVLGLVLVYLLGHRDDPGREPGQTAAAPDGGATAAGSGEAGVSDLPGRPGGGLRPTGRRRAA